MRTKVIYKYGLPDGLGFSWFSNGKRKYEAAFYRGNMHGVVVSYYKNGFKYYRGTFVHGKRHGRFDFWDKKGTAVKYCGYKRGVVQKCVKHSANTRMVQTVCKPGSTVAPTGAACPKGSKKITSSSSTRSFYCARKSKIGILVKHGPFEDWRDDGHPVKVQEGAFCNGKKHGRWQIHYELGNRVYRYATYSNGVLHGEKGDKWTSYVYVNGLRHGVDISRQGGSTDTESCFYVKGKKDGCKVPYPSQRRKLVCPGGTSLVGASPPRSTTLWCEDGSGKKHGPYVTWYSNGVLKEVGNYHLGKRNGHFNGWTKYGVLKHKGNYHNGRKAGAWEEWTNGHWGPTKTASGLFKNGRKHGIWKTWHPNGVLKTVGKYTRGAKTGSWVGYHHTSAKGYSGSYRNAKAHGSYVFWHDNGKISKKGRFIAGTMSGVWQFFHSTGRRSARGAFTHGKRHGRWVFFHEYGQKKGDGYFKRGLRHGTFREYSVSGGLIRQCRWRRGGLVSCRRQ